MLSEVSTSDRRSDWGRFPSSFLLTVENVERIGCLDLLQLQVFVLPTFTSLVLPINFPHFDRKMPFLFQRKFFWRSNLLWSGLLQNLGDVFFVCAFLCSVRASGGTSILHFVPSIRFHHVGHRIIPEPLLLQSAARLTCSSTVPSVADQVLPSDSIRFLANWRYDVSPSFLLGKEIVYSTDGCAACNFSLCDQSHELIGSLTRHHALLCASEVINQYNFTSISGQ